MTYDPKTYFTRRFERQGQFYVAKSGSPKNYQREQEAIEPFLRAVVKGPRVLDFGCGPGRFRSVLSEEGRHYDGVDLVDGLGTLQIDKELPANSYNSAVAVLVLQHIVSEEEYQHWTTQLQRCLVPRGRLVVVDCYIRPNLDEHMRPRGLRALVAKGGWTGARVIGEYAGHWMGYLDR